MRSCDKRFEAKAGRGGLFAERKPETSILLLSDVQRESGLDDDALTTGISLLHDLGVIMWHEYSSTLRNYVFTNPEWIVDLIRSVFRHDLFHRPKTKRKGMLYDLQPPPKALLSFRSSQRICVWMKDCFHCFRFGRTSTGLRLTYA